MKLFRTCLMLCLGLSASAAAKGDKPGCVDHPLLPTRMPGYDLRDCVTKEFDGYDFFVAKGPKRHEEGRFTFLTYALDRKGGQSEQSGLAVVRNYENALTKIGATIAATDPQRWVNGKVVIDGKEVWVQAEKGNGLIWLRIIEKAAMTQHIVADAAAFAKDLAATGHVAVDGILFDTGKAVLKAESTPALEEVAKLLKADAALKLWVVGHTDAVGRAEDNLKLAQARAEAVVAALSTTHGIAAARLKGYGVGPLAPVASNDTEEGRAKNRRVELVKQP
ncbi:MAG: OmpA family protein [Archangium sp.]|nr:OmpA family protein [Archangium sp.]